MNGLPARAKIGLASATIISLAARRAGALSPDGALAATGVGAAVVAGLGIRGGTMLVAFFTSSTLLGRIPTPVRLDQQRGRERDAVQVVANGGVAAVLALLSSWTQTPNRSLLVAGFGGAVATATADTWATEIGSRSRARPRSIRTLRLTRVGASGGVTVVGLMASAVGAALIAGMAPRPFAPVSRQLSTHAIAIALGGFIGALVDSLLGAIVQEVRFCDGCAVETEERIHHCGAQSRPLRGVPWCDNDVVNGLATAAGATASILLLVAMPARRQRRRPIHN